MPEFENRFAEVQRKSREARARLDAKQQARLTAEEQRAEAIRNDRESFAKESDPTPPDTTPQEK
jgi:hypothetical protein